MSELARRELLERASAYTASYRDLGGAAAPIDQLAAAPLLMAGHQPSLFHPGVWFKNFVLDELARRVGGVGVNLIVDGDICREATLRVPSGTIDAPLVEAVPIDAAALPAPYEERCIIDRDIVGACGPAAKAAIADLIADPMIEQFWPLVVDATSRVDRLGLAVAQARHAWEGRWGATTLELPQSAVCQLESFRWFAAGMLAELPRFVELFNRALVAYRRANRIRSANHPMPLLEQDEPWYEAPFWLWTASDPRRRRVFARQQGACIAVTDRQGLDFCLPLSAGRDAGAAVEALAEQEARGVKLRSRAITTTLFARVVLSDLFIHGIGGAKYDQLTDEVVRVFYGLEPPGFLTLSATLLLPIGRPTIEPDAPQTIDRTLRELEFHPERFLGGAAAGVPESAQKWVESKRQWLADDMPQTDRRRRHEAISTANEALQPLVAARREELIAERSEAARRQRNEQVLGSREYAFCLYPEESLRNFLLEFPRARA